MSMGGAKVGELGAADTSVSGVDGRDTDTWLMESTLDEEVEEVDLGLPGPSSQFAQKYTDESEGERIRGTFEHFWQMRSVRIYVKDPSSERSGTMMIQKRTHPLSMYSPRRLDTSEINMTA